MQKESVARKIVKVLKQAGFEAVFAGGCVRDQIRGVEPKDYDIATSARPEDVQRLFRKTIPVGVQFGVILVLEDETPFEVATFRTEGDYQDGRHPGTVNFATLKEDALRRDFTVNGLYLDPENHVVVDHVDGKRDIDLKIIRTIGDPVKRFGEDHLRMLRAVRFAVQLGYDIDPDTFAVIQAQAATLAKVSRERVRDELSKILTSQNPGRGVRLLDESGLMHYIIPEVEVMKGVEQPCEYHPEGDVYVHTLMLMDGLKEGAPLELAMGALLHDIAKPATFVRAADRIRFHGHDTIGAEMSREICKRLAFSNQQTELIAELVDHHLRFKDAFQMRVSTLKRFLGMDRFDLHLELHWLDCMASHKILDAYHFCKAKYAEFLAAPPPPSRILTGADLIALGFKPSPEFAKILRMVEDGVLEGTIRNKEEAIRWVQENVPPETK